MKVSSAKLQFYLVETFFKSVLNMHFQSQTDEFHFKANHLAIVKNRKNNQIN